MQNMSEAGVRSVVTMVTHAFATEASWIVALFKLSLSICVGYMWALPALLIAPGWRTDKV